MVWFEIAYQKWGGKSNKHVKVWKPYLFGSKVVTKFKVLKSRSIFNFKVTRLNKLLYDMTALTKRGTHKWSHISYGSYVMTKFKVFFKEGQTSRSRSIDRTFWYRVKGFVTWNNQVNRRVLFLMVVKLCTRLFYRRRRQQQRRLQRQYRI